MINLKKELRIEKLKNQRLKQIISLIKENNELEDHYKKLWFEKQHKRVMELLNNRKENEKN